MKKEKIIYWSTTALLSVAFLLSGILYLVKSPELMENMAKIGVPPFLIQLLGFSKLLGALAILNPWYPKIREWAYAGLTFILIGAVWAHVSTQTPFIAPLIFLLLIALSYVYSKKV